MISRLNNNKGTKRIITLTVINLLYIAYFYLAVRLLYQHELLIPVNAVHGGNIGYKFFFDVMVMLLFPLVIIFINRKQLKEIGFSKKNMGLCACLLVIYISFIYLHHDFSLSGFYQAFFYLFIVAACEEIIYRGHLYLGIKAVNPVVAILVSGILFGIGHAILPGIKAEQDFLRIFINMLNEANGGILGGFIFILLLELSGTIAVPILVHALLDYSYGGWGVLVCILTFVYLVVKIRIIDKQPFPRFIKKAKGEA